MGKKKNRIDTSEKEDTLTDNPFAGLGEALSTSELPESVPTPEPVRAEIVYKASHPYSVGRTRKGGWPVRKERRAAGKVVTLLGQVSGESKVLLKELQKALGVGGKVDGDTIQLQGDHTGAVQEYLDKAFES